MKKNKWTGERLETHVFNDNTIEHLHRYAIAMEFAENRVVLDIASGEGYGSNLLAFKAKEVIGVDISIETIKSAKLKYNRDNLNFRVGDTSRIPIDDNSIDLVVSFETIEHHDKHVEMMEEIKRVLKKDGVLIISSPDKRIYSDFNNYRNPFHVKELYFQEFKKLINSYFENTTYYFQRNLSGTIIYPEGNSVLNQEYYGSYTELYKSSDLKAQYNLCIASDDTKHEIGTSIFNAKDEIENALFEKIRASTTFKLGSLILFPLQYLKKWLNVFSISNNS